MIENLLTELSLSEWSVSWAFQFSPDHWRVSIIQYTDIGEASGRRVPTRERAKGLCEAGAEVMRGYCGTCVFFDPSAFECHKAPPLRLPRKFTPDADAGNRVRDETLLWGWPRVHDNDWCGEYRQGV